MLISSFFIEDTIYPDREIYFWFVAGHVAIGYFSPPTTHGLLAVEYPAVSSTLECCMSCVLLTLFSNEVVQNYFAPQSNAITTDNYIKHLTG